MNKNISIKVPSLTRVEGEGSLELEIKNNEITHLKFRIYEPPRLFEKLLQGRDYNDVIDIVARICGICPVAYQMSAVQAIENAFNTHVSDWVQHMRRVLYCGEWIESHSLHIHLLALPDFFGFDSAIAMAADYPEVITRGMRLQALGNAIVALLGKRSVHPVGVCVGGFYHAPPTAQVKALCSQLEEGIELSQQLLQWLTSLKLPASSQELTAVAISNPHHYAMIDGDIISTQGLVLPQEQFNERFCEHQVPHSTALHCLLDGNPYLVGPLARINLNHNYLHPKIKTALDTTGIAWPSNNMFHSIIARTLEIYQSFTEAHHILQNYQSTQYPAVRVTPQAGVGYGCTEAPRGMLWHRYQMAADGTVINANIIPPTSQNQAHIEKDLRAALQQYGLDHSDQELRHYSEMIIRNYDPCISCSTHFLNLKVRRQ